MTSSNPFREFPVHRKVPLFTRMVTGNISFLLTNIAGSLAPLSLMMICRQTSTFWTSIIAFLVMGEAIYPLEIIGMLLCFGAVTLVALQNHKETLDSTEEGDEELNPYNRKTIGICISLFGGVIVAMMAVSVRALKQVKVQIIVFYYSLFGYSATAIYIFVEMWITGEGSRLGQYTAR